MTTLYRYDSGCTADEVVLRRYVVEKETPAGRWVVEDWAAGVSGPGSAIYDNSRRWVSKTARKRYCYPTKEEAWESYRIRKQWRVKHLKRQLELALEERDAAEEWAGRYPSNPPEQGDSLTSGHSRTRSLFPGGDV
jgi:hypothetical protein